MIHFHFQRLFKMKHILTRYNIHHKNYVHLFFPSRSKFCTRILPVAKQNCRILLLLTEIPILLSLRENTRGNHFNIINISFHYFALTLRREWRSVFSRCKVSSELSGTSSSVTSTKKKSCVLSGVFNCTYSTLFYHTVSNPPPIWTPVYIFTLLCITINLKFNENNFKIIWKYCNTNHNSFYRITICCYTKLH